MGAPPPAVSAVRVAVRRCLTHHLGAGQVRDAAEGPGALILVACSGGADSLTLALAARFVASRLGLRTGLVTVDHRLQAGSDERAAALVSWAEREGFSPVLSPTVDATARPGGDGPEGTARTARYAALTAAARRTGASAILLGHTREDQAETVLLALARGSGPRGLAGMPERRLIEGVPFLRPLLSVARADVRAACLAEGLQPWEDPHNTDSTYARARVRAALPLLVEVLGVGVVANLARTATMIATDAGFLDETAGKIGAKMINADGEIPVAALAALAPAIRHRVLHQWCVDAGAARAALSSRHIEALDALVTAWRGQGAVALPSGLNASRRHGLLVVAPPCDVSDVSDRRP